MVMKEKKDYVESLEQAISQLAESDQLLATRLLRVIKAEYYNQDRPLRKFKESLQEAGNFKEGRMFSLLVELIQKLLGDYQAEVMEYIITHCTEYSYSVGYDRRPFRNKDKGWHVDKVIEKCVRLFDLYKYEFSTAKDLLSINEYEFEHSIISDIIAFEIDQNNVQFLQALKDIIYGDNNTAFLTRFMIKGMVTSHSEDAYHMLGDLLVAARLQEGLRQSIVETMDEGTLDATITLLRVIVDHNLIRYSSVVRALDVWTGLGLEAANTRIVKKCIQYAYDCLSSEDLRTQWLQSKDTNKLFMSMWATAVIEEEALEKEINKIMKQGETYQKIVALYVLSQSQNANLRHSIASDYLEETDQELQALILTNYALECEFSWNYTRGLSHYKLEIEMIPNLMMKQNRLRDFTLLYKMLEHAPKKEVTFPSKVLDWMEYTYSADIIASKLMYITAYDMNPAFICQLLRKKDLFSADTRSYLIDCFAVDDKDQDQRDFIFASLSDKSVSNREKAILRLKKMSLTSSEIEKIEGVLKLKTGSLRQQAMKLLLRLDRQDLEQSVDRLLHSKSELQRLGGLEIIHRLKESKDRSLLYNQLKNNWEHIKKPTEKELVLIEKLIEQTEYSLKNGFGLFDPSLEYVIPPSSIKPLEIGEVMTTPFERVKEILTGLSNLVHEHREVQYEVEWFDGYKESLLVGAKLEPLRPNHLETNAKGLERLPLATVWKEFMKKNNVTPSVILQLATYLHLDFIYRYAHKKLDYWEMHDVKKLRGWSETFIKELYPMEEMFLFHELFSEMAYKQQVENIISACFEEGEKREIFSITSRVLHSMIESIPEEKRQMENKLYEVVTSPWLEWTKENVYDDESFRLYFTSLYKLYKLSNYKRFAPFLEEVIRAYERQILDKNECFQELMARKLSRRHIDELTSRSMEFSKKHTAIQEFKDSIVPRILEIELKRGDLPTDVTHLAMEIQSYEGMEYFLTILSVLGKDTFVRGYIYYYEESNISRKEVLSHLLKVCYPKSGEDELLLQNLMEEKGISEKRLLEAAMYAPQWIDIVANYLKWDGLKAAAWYFHAHVNETFTAEKETIVAHYSPITPEEFNDGAFDIDWFKSAYNQLGEERFDILYDCAKYISGGSNHRRAQLFAQATLGKLTLEEMKDSVVHKRNKDHLLCYSLIPIAAANPNDTLERYKFIQQFLKESKNFGAQRRATESKTATIALDNLARNAGYKDLTRLRWDMEAKLAQKITPYLQPYQIDDVTVQLVWNEQGRGEIKILKNGKPLKSVPAKYKKHEYILALKEVTASLKDQSIRAKLELERSMETANPFSLQELTTIIENPVVSPYVSALVFKVNEQLGFFREGMLQSPSGETYVVQPMDDITVAHPVHLYESGEWSSYQKYLFDTRMKQPFKQVFRELYRINQDEQSAGTISSRYAGHQVNPRKTVALLKNRMWTVSHEEGLQKVFYKENMVAKIYALADWFSPSDVECPTIETVEFVDRHTFKSIELNKVPKVIFSEIMRDIDLVVSVAHVGGVDPEASLTTVEMRAAIVQESLRLMKISSVKIEGNFAIIVGHHGEYSVHLGSGMVYKQSQGALYILPVHSQHRGKIFLPFIDEDPRTAEIISKIILLAEDTKIKDPHILEQIKR